MIVRVQIKLKSGESMSGVSHHSELKMDKASFKLFSTENTVVSIPTVNIEYVTSQRITGETLGSANTGTMMAANDDDFNGTLQEIFGRGLDESVSEDEVEPIGDDDEDGMSVAVAKVRSASEHLQEMIDNGPPVDSSGKYHGGIGAVITNNDPESVRNAEDLAYSVKSGVDGTEVDDLMAGMDSEAYEALHKSICGMYDGGMNILRIAQVTKLTELEICSILEAAGRKVEISGDS